MNLGSGGTPSLSSGTVNVLSVGPSTDSSGSFWHRGLQSHVSANGTLPHRPLRPVAAPDLLDYCVEVLAAVLLDLLVALLPVRLVIHQLGDRRARPRRDLDEVQLALAGQLPGPLDGDDSDLLPTRSDQPDLGGPNEFVDSWFGDRSSR